MRTTSHLATLFCSSLIFAAGCAVETSDPDPDLGPGDQTVSQDDMVKPEEGKADSSAHAIFVDFEFDGELIASSSWNAKSAINDQLLYLIGHLNGEKSVGRLDKVELTNVQTSSVDGKTRVTYHAKLPVAWGKKDSVPTRYTLKLPKNGTFAGYEAFTQKYSKDCVDWGAHDVDAGSMWYYYRPKASRCNLDPADIVISEASVAVSQINTTGKYPEYHRVWEDDLLKVVAIFGKYEDGATTSSDAGIAAYNEFVGAIKSKLSSHALVTTPETIPSSPGVGTPDVVLSATLPDGKKVEVTALLVDNVRTAGATFDARYNQLSSTADLITYNGHAGLGANVRALAKKGNWIAGQYAMVFMNGCDTYAYVDSALWDAHAAVNADDPAGTKYVDIVTNAMPSFFREMPTATLALFSGLLAHSEPKTYEQIFKDISSSQVVLVSGEADNEYFPGWPGGGGEPVVWEGMQQSGSVSREQEARYETPKLAPGKYRFDMTGTNDADLYVRVGQAPTKTAYDCRPYKYGSKESCVVELTVEAPIHVMVRGWAASSSFQVAGLRQ
jgi:hypothetical protein